MSVVASQPTMWEMIADQVTGVGAEAEEEASRLAAQVADQEAETVITTVRE